MAANELPPAVPRRFAEGARSPRRLLMAVSALALAAASVVAALSIVGFGPKVAYAVTEHPDGTVTIDLQETYGVTSLNDHLSALGIKAKAYRMDPSCPEATPELDWGNLYPRIVTQNGSPDKTVTIDPSAIPANTTLVLAAREGPPDATTGGAPSILVRLMLVADPAPTCVGQVLSDPLPPPPGSQRIEVPRG